MRRISVLSVALLITTACAGETSGPPGGPGKEDGAVTQMDAGQDSNVFVPPDEDAGPRPMMTVAAGDVSGEWCGDVTVTGDVDVPAGSTLEVCAGAIVKFADNARLNVEGTLKLLGDATHEVVLYGDGTWVGVRVSGTFAADFARIRDGSTCVQGVDGSSIRVDDSVIEECSVPIHLSNGGTFDRTTVKGGTSINITGGTLHMTDTSVDMLRPAQSPDCIIVQAGALDFDHVRVTGCHCPLHFNSGEGASTVTNSIFDGAAIPLMIKRATGDFSHNHFIGANIDLQDIETLSEHQVDIDVSDSYFGGDAPNIDVNPTYASQFKGTGSFRTTPVPGAGPR